LEPSGDWRADDICLTLMTLKVLPGRWRNTVLMGFSDLGKKVKYERECFSK
jgi:hypothetical protein